MVTFKFDVFPISVNKLYSTKFGQRRRFLTTEGRKFKEHINDEVAKSLANIAFHKEVSSFVGKLLAVELDVYSSSWLLKNQQTIRVKDIGNIEKALLDAIFSAFNENSISLDDSQIWSLTLTKHFSTNPDTTVVSIKEFEGTV